MKLKKNRDLHNKMDDYLVSYVLNNINNDTIINFFQNMNTHGEIFHLRSNFTSNDNQTFPKMLSNLIQSLYLCIMISLVQSYHSILIKPIIAY